MIEFEEIREPLKKCLEVVSKNKNYHGINPLNVKYFSAAIFNHYFKDNPDAFGITRMEGLKMRDWIHESGINGRNYMDYIEILHREFPEYFEKEDKGFLENANEERAHRGEKPIVLG